MLIWAMEVFFAVTAELKRACRRSSCYTSCCCFHVFGRHILCGFKKKKKGILPDCVWVKLFLVLQLIWWLLVEDQHSQAMWKMPCASPVASERGFGPVCSVKSHLLSVHVYRAESDQSSGLWLTPVKRSVELVLPKLSAAEGSSGLLVLSLAQHECHEACRGGLLSDRHKI